MTLKRYELTPQMRDYDAMKDPGERRYLPYLMYFHRVNFASQSVNTDRSGFRISAGPDGVRASAAGHIPPGPVRILAGGSTALGVGASDDANTLASLLWRRYAPSAPWLNFGSYCYNPTQEALLFTLYRHVLGSIDEIVIVSGINAVMVARFPEWQQGDHGAFFFCGEYFEKMAELRERSRTDGKRFGRRGRRGAAAIATLDDLRRDIPAVISAAAELTLRQLDIWQRMAGPDTRVSYVLQPMTRWMDRPSAPQERVLFDENDRNSELGVWEHAYGDIATMQFGQAYAAALQTGCDKQGVRFVDLNPVIGEATSEQDWMFVDRVHYTDTGHDIVARATAEALELT
ncbi:MAG: Inducer of phenazine A [Jatrophihabitantaceae bacterium]